MSKRRNRITKRNRRAERKRFRKAREAGEAEAAATAKIVYDRNSHAGSIPTNLLHYVR